MMSKKDYTKFAEMIAKRRYRIERQKDYKDSLVQSYQYHVGFEDCLNWMEFELGQLYSDMIDIFQSDNPSFDANRFNDYIEKRVEELSHQ
jgi:hypothetical protein